MERMIKIDAENKATIKKLKNTLNEICQDFEKVDQKIMQATSEKEQLEKVVLEIVGFSDCCDSRFEDVLAKIEAFKKQD